MKRFQAIILIGIVFGIGIIWYFASRGCEVVDGNSHIYSQQCLPEGFVPELITLSPRASYLLTEKELSPDAALAIERLILDAEKDGMCIVVIGAYRSFKYQKEIYESSGEDKSGIALPGRSEHQTGLAADFTGCPMDRGKRDDSIERPDLADPFEDLPEYQWLVENAGRYGFVQSYSEDNARITGYPAESWHWKYIRETD